MNKIGRLGLTIAASAGLSIALVSPSLAECKTLGAIGTGISEDIAKFMAEAGLKNIREERGMQPQGPIKYKCDTTLIVTECSARQRACK